MKKIEELVALGHRHGALAIHPYFGRMDPALAGLLISEFSSPGDWVLDPFCGSGTVLHEALLLGRNATGWDSSPLAAMIAASKVAGVSKEVRSEVEYFCARFEPYAVPEGGLLAARIPECPVPDMARVTSVSKWFGENALRELAFIRSELQRAQIGEHARLLLLTGFSRCITSASRQKGESKYTAVDKPDYASRVVRLFLESVRHVLRSAEAFSGLRDGAESNVALTETYSYSVKWPDLSVDVFSTDTRGENTSGQREHDLIVTSPPYLMSWDYGLYHKFRFYWLGLDLDNYEDSEIGRHLRRRRDDVERYRHDMKGVFVRLSQGARRGARVAFVNAPSAVKGVSVDTNEILQECAEAAGFSLDWRGTSVAIPGPHHGMYASLLSRGATTAGERGKREHVLLFTKT